MSNEVLDTLKFKNGQIFLKKYHAQRTYEALVFKNANLPLEKIISFYDRIEKEFCLQISSNQILRISVPLEGLSNSFSDSKIEVLEKGLFANQPSVQMKSNIIFPSGIGKQNFKWTQRESWTQLLSQKSPEADDIIAINDLGQITETSRCNIFFFDIQNNLVLTPRLDSGCINGVYRRFVLENGFIDLPELGPKKVIEKNILAAEVTTDSLLAEDKKKYKLFLANSVREVLPARIYNSAPSF